MAANDDFNHNLYGVIARFDTTETLLAAAQRAYARGYRRMDAFTPFPVEGLAAALGFKRNRIPLLVFIGALVGAVGAYVMQYYAAVIDYPINVGGRPLHSWPAFLPVTFELAILGGALAGFFGMLALNRLPEPYHPVFNAACFELASRNAFFLCIQADDVLFDLERTQAFLRSLGAQDVAQVLGETEIAS